jgi:ABC-type Zn uptake system ZnuABC Zn-binding protein ZnuA
MSTRATEDTLALIHERMALKFLNLLDGEPSAAELAVIAKFLKDNNITAVPSTNNALGALVARLQESMEDM